MDSREGSKIQREATGGRLGKRRRLGFHAYLIGKAEPCPVEWHISQTARAYDLPPSAALFELGYDVEACLCDRLHALINEYRHYDALRKLVDQIPKAKDGQAAQEILAEAKESPAWDTYEWVTADEQMAALAEWPEWD